MFQSIECFLSHSPSPTRNVRFLIAIHHHPHPHPQMVSNICRSSPHCKQRKPLDSISIQFLSHQAPARHRSSLPISSPEEKRYPKSSYFTPRCAWYLNPERVECLTPPSGPLCVSASSGRRWPLNPALAYQGH